MTISQQILTIVAVVLGTMTTRFLPFSSSRREKSRRPSSAIWGPCCPAPSSACWSCSV
ncbi:MAG: hypothetical protein ACLUNZ_09175 [Evtepia sp.]